MLPGREKTVDRFGLATALHVDGFGPRHAKRESYGLLSSKDGVIPGGRVHNGYKLFLSEDVPLQERRGGHGDHAPPGAGLVPVSSFAAWSSGAWGAAA